MLATVRRNLPGDQCQLLRHHKGTKLSSIPLVDVHAQHEAVADEVALGWQDVLAQAAFIGGPQVAAFERE